VASAVGWGALAASSLVIGALLGLGRPWPARAVGHVLAFGAGALISAVSFDLAEEGAALGGPGTLGVGLAAGALTYFFLDRAVERRESTGSGDSDAGAGVALAVGALLDGIPEQLVLGISVSAGAAVSAGLIVAIFVSNLPEAIGASTDLRSAGFSAGRIRRLWLTVFVVSVIAAAAGYALGDITSGNMRAAINGFAAGALLVMLIDSMIPEAARKAGRTAGLATVFGFALAAGISGVT
jgi:ZIP family zinc transporter